MLNYRPIYIRKSPHIFTSHLAIKRIFKYIHISSSSVVSVVNIQYLLFLGKVNEIGHREKNFRKIHF